MKWKKGDRCSPRDEDWTGRVVEISGNRLRVRDDEGFDYWYDAARCVPAGPLDPGTVLSPKDRPKRKTPGKTQSLPVLDLHAERLMPCRKLPREFILDCQLNELRLFLQMIKQKKIRKFRIVHGRGQGILRRETEKILRQAGFRHFWSDDLTGGSLRVEW